VPTDAELLDRTFHALADSSRRSIVVRLSEGPASVSELAEPLEMSLSAVVQHIEVLRLVVDGEHCVAILDIDTTFGPIPFAEHIHVVNGQILSVRGYCDPRPMLAGRA